MGLTIILLENVSTSVKGLLSKWLFELKPGVFIGTISAKVRSEVILLLKEKIKQGGIYIIHPYACEQRFIIDTIGTVSRPVYDFEGLQLAGKPTTRVIDSPSLNENNTIGLYVPISPIIFTSISSNRLSCKIKTQGKFSQKKGKRRKKKPYWKIQQETDVLIPDWAPQNFPSNFIERTLTFSDLNDPYVFDQTTQSSYWGYSPVNIWQSEQIEEIISALSQFPELIRSFLPKLQETDPKIWEHEKIVICSLDIETTTYLPKAFEGFINIIGITRLELIRPRKIPTQPQKMSHWRSTVEIFQIFNMLRKRDKVPILLERSQEKLNNCDYLIVFNRDFDIKILHTVIQKDNCDFVLPEKIIDVHSKFPKLEAIEEELWEKHAIGRQSTTKGSISQYYQQFQGKKSADGLRLIEPIGIYNIFDTLTPLASVLEHGLHFF